MPAIMLAKGRYDRRENVPTRNLNLYFEQDPTNVDDQVSLISRPGMAPFATLAGPSVVGIIPREDADGSLLCVSGTVAQAVSSEGIVTSAGTGIAGTGRVSMATDGANIMIARDGTLYVQTGAAVTAVEMPDDIAVLNVVFLSGRFWIATELDGRVYFTIPGEVTVDALNYFSAEGTPDPLVGIAVSGDELILLGRSSVEYWSPTGDQDLPAQRILGRASRVGCASRFSIATGDLVAWVGDDCMVYRSGDALPMAIGDAGLADMIRKARPGLDETDPAKTLNGWMFALDQHVFYVLDVPGYGSFGYDFTTSQWSEFGSVGRPLFAAGCGAKLSEGRWVIGGTFDGRLRIFTPDAMGDEGAPIVRRFTGLTRSKLPMRFSNVQVECSVGRASLAYPDDNPKLAMRFSDDDGKTFSDFTYASLGLQGQYMRRPTFKNPQRMRPGTRLWEFRTSNLLPFTVHTASYDERVR